MNIQIIGTKKSPETRKTQRFFSDRGIKVHFLDLTVRQLKSGELRNIASRIDLEDLIDRNSAEYKNGGFEYMDFDIFEELLEHQGLLKLPIVRNGSLSTVGFEPKIWQQWVTSD